MPFKFGNLANILRGLSVRLIEWSRQEAACKLGVTHGNREKQDKYLLWIAEKGMEL